MAARPMTTLEMATDRLIGKMGLIRACKSILLGPGEPRLYSVTAIPAQTSRYMNADMSGEAGAVGFDHAQAIHGAIGECIERYSAGYFDRDELVHASKNELGDAAIGMDELAIHAPDQYDHPRWPFKRWSPDDKHSWVKGNSMVTGELRYVPAAVVYVPYTPLEDEGILCLSVSTGQSCHTDRDRAVLTGLFEVVERDAIMITWLRRLQIPRVDYMKDPVLGDLHERYLSGSNLTFHVFDMTLDIKIPSYVCFVEGESPRGRIMGMGASTRNSPREAITKALLEAAQDMIWCRDLVLRKPDWRPEPDWSNIREFEDHVRLYCEEDMHEHLSFIKDTPTTVTVDPDAEPNETSAEAIERCVKHLHELGYEPILIDTTPPDIAAAGFYVPKVIIPQLVPLTSVHRLLALGSPRLQTVPEKIGYPHQDGFNPIPHPFP